MNNFAKSGFILCAMGFILLLLVLGWCLIYGTLNGFYTPVDKITNQVWTIMFAGGGLCFVLALLIGVFWLILKVIKEPR
jgi:flagellar biogenesis protein FliO